MLEVAVTYHGDCLIALTATFQTDNQDHVYMGLHWLASSDSASIKAFLAF
jgi:hypothetical protein